MSDPKAASEPVKPSSEPKASAPNAPKPRREFRHPTLQAMGISRLRIPSRNWLIFWAVTGSIFGGVWYDRRERKRVRDYWREQVAELSKTPLGALELPRKVKVYIAPPPNDFLDVTLKHFRNYIKPILTSAAVDHQVISEDQQGHIRSVVAEEIRNKRRKAQGLETTGYQPDELDNKIDSKLTRDPTGGVICVGRGAYKEYLAGLQEGWMGPLEEPQFVRDEAAAKEAAEKAKKEAEAAAKAEKEAKKNKPVEPAAETAEPVNEATELSDATESNEPSTPPLNIQVPTLNDAANAKKEETPAERVPKLGDDDFKLASWLRAEHYPEAVVADEFMRERHEPIAVMEHPHLLGFLNTPFRLVRYFNQRKLADQMGRETYAVITSQTRPFVAEDVDLAASDELDWPNKWKQNGRDVNSEWMREFRADPRITEQLQVYEFKSMNNSELN